MAQNFLERDHESVTFRRSVTTDGDNDDDGGNGDYYGNDDGDVTLRTTMTMTVMFQASGLVGPTDGKKIRPR